MTNEVKGLIAVLVAPAIIMIGRNWDRLGALQSAQAEDREKRVACEWIAGEVAKEGIAGKRGATALVRVLAEKCNGFKTG